MEHPTFPRLYEHTPLEVVGSYLRNLAQSDYSYHLDDHPSDVIWSKRHRKDIIAVLAHNASILWRLHIKRKQSWEKTWEIYAEEVNAKTMNHG